MKLIYFVHRKKLQKMQQSLGLSHWQWIKLKLMFERAKQSGKIFTFTLNRKTKPNENSN